MYNFTLQVISYGFVLLVTITKLTRCQDDSTEERVGVPIIRQINKVNDDGTYTYGYEAADGSFKIETRDVLGNVKGMFGFIDESGELKRVSYTANNETGFRNSVIHAPTPAALKSITENGRRPVFILKNTPALHSPTKGPVIQHIPKKPNKEEDEPSSTTSSPTNGRRFPGNSSDDNLLQPEDSVRSSANPLRKILISKRPIEDKETRGKGGNHLRRQLSRGLDLRGETSHIYSGSDNRFPPSLPPHLSALMSELRPVQVVRMTPDSVGYQTVDVEAASQEITELPQTTTEVPYGSRKLIPVAYLHPRYRQPVPLPDESRYTTEASQHYRLQHVPITQAPIPPQVSQIPIPNGNYQTQPHYYEQPHPPFTINPSVLRDELMTIIYNYLQVRLSPSHQYSRYPYPSPYSNPLFTPNYAYPQPVNYPHPQPVNYPPVPYTNPYVTPIPHYYPPPYANPNSLYPVVPTQTPLSGPNVQFSPKPESPRRGGSHRVPAIRATSPADDADLLQMLLTSPTRIPVHQLRYSSEANERLNTQRRPQPVRNVQIITEASETRPLTTESPE